MPFKSNLLVAVTSIAWLGSPYALAQEPPADSPPTSPDLTESAQTPSASQDLDQGAPTQDAAAATAATPADDASTLSDQKIDQFASALMEVQTIQQKAATDLESTADATAADEVRNTAQTDMIAAVERSGLKVEEFNEIAQSMASNVEVRNRVAAKMQKRSGG